MAIGHRRQRFTIQTLDPAAAVVTSLTRSGSTATAVTTAAHGFATGDRVTVAGAGEAGYNGTHVVTVVNSTTFTFAVSGTPTTPATGTITAVYASDRLHGQRRVWRDLFDIRGRLRFDAGRGETLQTGQVAAPVTYRIEEIRYRTGLTTKQRAVMADGRAFEIMAVVDPGGARRDLTLYCVERQEQ